MGTVAALTYQQVDGADRAIATLRDRQWQQLITVQDDVVVSWPPSKKGPKTRQATNLAGIGALDGAFWGMLSGRIVFVPFFGPASGAAMGAICGAMRDGGIDDHFITQVRSQGTAGTSAPFVLSSGAVTDRVIRSK